MAALPYLVLQPLSGNHLAVAPPPVDSTAVLSRHRPTAIVSMGCLACGRTEDHAAIGCAAVPADYQATEHSVSCALTYRQMYANIRPVEPLLVALFA